MLKDGAMENIKLTELLDVNQVQAMMDDFYKLSNIGAAFADIHGNILVATGWQDICTQFHRVNPEAKKFCIASDTILSENVQPGEFKLYKCKNNLWDIATPLVVHEKHIGNLFLGQFFFEDEQPDYDVFRAQARQYGFDEEQYLAALDHVPRWSRETVNTAMSFYTHLANMISRLTYSNLELAQTLDAHRQTTESLRKSESLLASTQRLSQVGGWEWDTQKQTLFWTDETYRIHDMEPDDTISGLELIKESLACYRPEDRDLVFEHFRRCSELGESYDLEVPFTSKTGQAKWVRTTAEAVWEDDRVVKVIGNIMDITDRKLTEENLAVQLTLYQRLMDAIPAPVFYKDTEGRYIDFNDAFEEFFGTSRKNLIGKSVYDIAPKELADRYHEKDLSLFLSPGTQTYESMVKNARGELRNIIFHKATFTDQNDQVAGLIGVMLDITERIAAEAAMRESEAKYRQLFENMTIGIAVWERIEDNDFILRDINQAGQTLSGVIASDVIGKKAREAFPGIEAMGLLDVLREVWQTGEPRHHPVSLYKDGKKVQWFENSVFKLPNGQLISAYNDVTDRKMLEQQYLQAQKMEAVGQLAGGVAHDFRNQLTVILGYSEMLRRKKLVQKEDLPKVDAIIQAVDRSITLTSQLLAFSRKQTLQPKVIDLAGVVTKISATLPQLLGEDIKLIIETGKPPHYSLVDQAQFEQAIINLAVNARDAMPKGGDLIIETSCTQLSPAAAQGLWGLKPGSYVMVKISDSGIGMEEDALSRIFEPFYTTKNVGEGTGLGLAMVFGFVKQSGGSIDVQSTPNAGTTFQLFFPLVDSPHEEIPESEKQAEVFRGAETIMVVEDEDSVRNLLVASLQEVGYTVIETSTADEALQASGEFEGPINLLLTDIVMPGKSGVDLSEQIIKSRPEIRVLYISGYAKKTLSSRGVDPSKLSLLTKPVEHDELIKTVRKILDSVGT